MLEAPNRLKPKEQLKSPKKKENKFCNFVKINLKRPIENLPNQWPKIKEKLLKKRIKRTVSNHVH